MNHKVSIIVPIYNVEKYLRECLDSVLAQSYTDWEAILVDDGSPDLSGAICDEYASKDTRFKVFHKQNGGVSSARNMALEHAHGRYIMFMDSDDMLFSNAIETLVKYIHDGIDSVCCTYLNTDEIGNVTSYSSTQHFEKVLDRDETLIDFYTPLYGNLFNGYLVTRLFRTSIINEHHLRFREDLYIKEDGLFIVQYLSKCMGKHYFSSELVYKHRINGSSVMRTFGQGINYKSVSGVIGLIECHKEIANTTKDVSLLKLSRERIAARYLFLSYSAIRKGQFSIREIFRLWKVVFQYATIGDFFRLFWHALKRE